VRPNLRWLLAGPLLLLAGALVSFGCGGGGSAGTPSDPSAIATATAPNPLPEPLIVGAASPVPRGDTYTVQDGDSLSAIAERFGVSPEEIAAANNITDPTSLAVGQVLIIPGATVDGDDSDVLGATEAPPTTPTPPAGEQQVYIVQDGDIPETIAAQFGITAEELMAANGITDPTSLQIGQELIIPAPQSTE
jgi:LysM repeat protein